MLTNDLMKKHRDIIRESEETVEEGLFGMFKSPAEQAADSAAAMLKQFGEPIYNDFMRTSEGKASEVGSDSIASNVEQFIGKALSGESQIAKQFQQVGGLDTLKQNRLYGNKMETELNKATAAAKSGDLKSALINYFGYVKLAISNAYKEQFGGGSSSSSSSSRPSTDREKDSDSGGSIWRGTPGADEKRAEQKRQERNQEIRNRIQDNEISIKRWKEAGIKPGDERYQTHQKQIADWQREIDQLKNELMSQVKEDADPELNRILSLKSFLVK